MKANVVIIKKIENGYLVNCHDQEIYLPNLKKLLAWLADCQILQERQQ